MDPSGGLLAASGLATFLLKTTAEWLVCLLLVHIAGSARSRFNLWLTMLLAFVAQWIWMWVGVVRGAVPAQRVAASAASAVPATAEYVAVAATAATMVSRGMAVLVACYLGVVVWRMLGSLAARVRLARALRYKSTPDRRVATTFREVAEQTEGLGRELRGAEVWVLPGLTSPATLGWLRPRVIVPPSCELQDEAELQAVFWHELKHVERRDALWNGMVRACRTLLWFHPAVHHATAALHAQRELACDAAVVDEHPQSRDVYATCLVRFARAADLSPGPAIPTIDMASSAALLTRRVRSILSDGQATSRGARLARAAANVLLVGLMAATVPGLNILFAMEQAKVEVGLPRMGAAPAMAKVHVRKANAQGVAAVQPVVGSAGQGLALQHDEELAAQHRAAMGILTESTGMDDTATGDSRMAGGLNGAPGRGANPANAAAWGTIAMDAAERMGPLMNGHDSDDHH